ncbi:hypothetical protein GDO78_015011 [Eleutherodactylus coqui]|uniref:Uncharacterized protein n=1 Tax=Eleutherodactylus coqui TaxID=57060 RepID=A0A8J6JWP7_ELECQ|nr:hypothetical protein GDO78_015011 [Eleutherodactylus coqui]
MQIGIGILVTLIILLLLSVCIVPCIRRSCAKLTDQMVPVAPVYVDAETPGDGYMPIIQQSDLSPYGSVSAEAGVTTLVSQPLN